MRVFPLVPLTDMADIHDYLREPVSQTERNKREGAYPYYGATGQVGWIDGFRQDGKYVLLGEDGAPFLDSNKNKAYIVEGKCWVNNHAHVLKGKANVCDDDFLCFALNWADYSEAVTGSTRLKLPQNTMNRLLIPKPHIDEQRRIAARLKAQLAEVGTARQAAQVQLRDAALLCRTFLRDAFNDLPGKQVLLSDIAHIDARLVNPTDQKYSRLPHVSAENIIPVTGRLQNIRSAAEDGMESGKYLFDSGDVLYSKLRPYLRKVAIADFDGLCSADMYPLKFDPKVIDGEFLRGLLVSDDFTAYANEMSSRSRMPKLNREQLFAYEFHMPSLDHQRHIVTTLKQQLAEADALRAALEQQLRDLDALPQRILAQTFNIEEPSL